jgi:hypothetical protein
MCPTHPASKCQSYVLLGTFGLGGLLSNYYGPCIKNTGVRYVDFMIGIHNIAHISNEQWHNRVRPHWKCMSQNGSNKLDEYSTYIQTVFTGTHVCRTK